MRPPRLESAQRRLCVFLGAASFFEGYDFMAITQILPNLRADLGLSPGQAGVVVGIANLGLIASALLVRLSDRWGRRRVLSFTLAGYALASLASGLAPGAWSFAICQLLARMFLIGEWATSMVYAAEAFPDAWRGRAIGLVQALGAVGAVACAGLTPLLLQAPWGWRTVYFAGALPIALLLFARRNLPETRRFAATLAEAPPRFGAVLQPPHRRKVLVLAGLWVLLYAGTHNATTFWKEFAVSERGFSDADVGRSLTVAALVAMPAVFFVGKLLDAVGRRAGSAIIFPLTALGVWGAFTFRSPAALTFAMALAIFGASAVLPVAEAYTSELFPTRLRGQAFAWANALLGRTGSVLLPPLIGLAAEEVGWGRAVAATAVFDLLALALVLAFLPETRGRSLEETAA